MKKQSIPVEAKAGIANGDRNKIIEECAKHLQEKADKINDVVVKEREKLSEETMDCFYWEKQVRRTGAMELRKLKS